MKKIDDVECARSLVERAREAEGNEETAKAKEGLTEAQENPSMILFIYGTLMTNQRRNFYRTRDGAKCVGEARTARAWKRWTSWRALLGCSSVESSQWRTAGRCRRT